MAFAGLLIGISVAQNLIVYFREYPVHGSVLHAVILLNCSVIVLLALRFLKRREPLEMRNPVRQSHIMQHILGHGRRSSKGNAYEEFIATLAIREEELFRIGDPKDIAMGILRTAVCVWDNWSYDRECHTFRAIAENISFGDMHDAALTRLPAPELDWRLRQLAGVN